MDLDFSSLATRRTELQKAMAAVAKAGGQKLFPLDFLAWAAANRSMALIAAFESLIRARNYGTAAAVLRLQIDTGLRFMAAWHVERPHDLAQRVLAGHRIDKEKDKLGNRLTDRHLAKLASQDEPWIHSVYEATSGFVHLSDRHIIGAVDGTTEDAVIHLKVSDLDSAVVSDADRQEAIDAFDAAVGFVLRYLRGWGATKDWAESREREA